jgi:hypothetical protein
MTLIPMALVKKWLMLWSDFEQCKSMRIRLIETPCEIVLPMLTVDMAVSQRDAEYIVECLRILLQDETSIDQTMALSLDDGEISDEAIAVFARFLHEAAQCLLHALYLF